MTITLDSYGLHWDNSVAWLVQGRKGSNFVGLKQTCPFTVKGGVCNHMVPPAAPIPDRIHWEQWSQIAPDPLVQAMFPIPHPEGENVFFVEDPHGDLSLYLTTLSRLSSPIKPVIRPCWAVKPRFLEKELVSSNIQPLVLTQADQKCQETLDALGQLSMTYPRTVVVTGSSSLVVTPPVRRIKTAIRDFNIEDLMTLPMENLGAVLIRRRARREALDAPWETREDRRRRQIDKRT